MSKVEIVLGMTEDAEVFNVTESFTLGDCLDVIATELRIDNGEDYFFPEIEKGSEVDIECDIDEDEVSLRAGGTFIVDITDEHIEDIKENGIGIVFKHEDDNGEPVDLEEIGLEPYTFICTFDVSIKKL